MKLTVANIRGVEHWEGNLVPGGVTLVRQPNGTGKTTIAATVAALMARDSDPLGLGTALRQGYVRTGADPESAIATLEDDAWSLQWHVASGQFHESGKPPQRPPDIVGRAMRYAWQQGGREASAQAWLEALIAGEFHQSEIAEAIRDALGDAVADGGARIADQLADDVIEDPVGGWKRAADYCHERVLEAKRTWKDVVAKDGSAENYGARKASNWRPKAWHPDLEQGSVSERERELHEARESEVGARDQLATFDSKMETWEQDQAEVEGLKAQREQMRERLDAIEGADYSGNIDKAESMLFELRTQLEEQEQRSSELRDAYEAAVKAEDAIIAERNKAGEAVSAAHQAHMTAAEDFDEKSRERAKLVSIYNATLAQSQAVADGTCPTCGQPVHDGEVEKLAEEAKENLPGMKATIETLSKELDGLKERKAMLEASLDAAKRQLEAIQSDDRFGRARDLADHGRATVATVKRLRSDIETAEKGLAKAKSTSKPDTAELRGEIRALGRVIKEKERGVPKPGGRDALVQLVDHAHDDVVGCTRDLDALRVHQEAQRQHRLASVWQAAHDVLSPDKGIRKSRLDFRVGKLNAYLSRFVGMFDLPHLELSANNLRVMWGRRVIDLASESQQWLAATFVRTALASMHRAPVVVIDRADVIQPAARRDELRGMVAQLAEAAGMAVLWAETGE